MSKPEPHRLFAIRYGHKGDRKRHENFVAADPHDRPMPMDYYVWVIANEQRTIVVDTGFDPEEGRRRRRQLLRTPREGLAMLGIDAGAVQEVILTHLHYDHAGTLGDFPRAVFHLQEREMAYATGRYMGHESFRQAYCARYVQEMVDRVYRDRVRFHDGDGEIAPGVSVHLLGGHTMGLQCVRVLTDRGWVVLASDASHYYENMEAEAPFPIVHDLGAMIRGYGTLRKLADSRAHIIPGHDPLVMERYPAPEGAAEGVIACLHVAPRP